MNVTESILQKLSRWKRDPKFTGLRKITNQMYYDEDTATLELPRLLGHAILEIDGCKFNVDQTVGGLHALIAYPYAELARPDDIALDLGAFVGGITIPLAKKVKKVYALEPLYYEELRTNVKLNDLSNVVVIPAALGKEENTTRIRYGTKETLVPTTSFQKLKELAGHIDFLKSNCEGGEWDIDPNLYEGIREIRIEFHISRTCKKYCLERLKVLWHWLKTNDYECNYYYQSLNWYPDHYGFYSITASRR